MSLRYLLFPASLAGSTWKREVQLFVSCPFSPSNLSSLAPCSFLFSHATPTFWRKGNLPFRSSRAEERSGHHLTSVKVTPHIFGPSNSLSRCRPAFLSRLFEGCERSDIENWVEENLVREREKEKKSHFVSIVVICKDHDIERGI
jgi:hypothetical protein